LHGQEGAGRFGFVGRRSRCHAVAVPSAGISPALFPMKSPHRRRAVAAAQPGRARKRWKSTAINGLASLARGNSASRENRQQQGSRVDLGEAWWHTTAKPVATALG
jgi:hypothetical protein